MTSTLFFQPNSTHCHSLSCVNGDAPPPASSRQVLLMGQPAEDELEEGGVLAELDPSTPPSSLFSPSSSSCSNSSSSSKLPSPTVESGTESFESKSPRPDPTESTDEVRNFSSFEEERSLEMPNQNLDSESPQHSLLESDSPEIGLVMNSLTEVDQGDYKSSYDSKDETLPEPDLSRKKGFLFNFGLVSRNKVFSWKKEGEESLCMSATAVPPPVPKSSPTTVISEEAGLNNKSSDRRSLHHRLSKSSSESNLPFCHNSLQSSASAPSSGEGEATFPINSGEEPICSSGQIPVRRNSSEDGALDPLRILQEVESGLSNGPSQLPSTSNPTGNPDSTHSPFRGPKFKLLSEGDIQVCKVKHGQNLMSKLTSSKLLRRWETHHIYLNDLCISSKTPIGSLTRPISYWQMEEVYVVIRWDSGKRYIIRILLPDGSLLLQAPSVYSRDQWYHSLIWKRNIFKYQNLMRSSKRPEVILKELKSLVELSRNTPLSDDSVSLIPVEIVANLLDSAGDLLGRVQSEEMLVALSPLLEKSHPPPALCRFFSRHCISKPRSPLVQQIFTPVVRKALKHNPDFGKHPYMRRFIQDYFLALNMQNDGINVVRNFVKGVHGPGSGCPHPRVMSNLVSVSLAAIFAIFERNNSKRASNLGRDLSEQVPWDEELLCYLAIFDAISEFDDWRPSLAQLLQPIPFPEDAMMNPLFTRSFSSVIRRIGNDTRCDVHQMLLGVREEKEGWFQLYSPHNFACFDDLGLWGLMLERLLSCCCRRKRFLSLLVGKLLGSCLLLALREHRAAEEALCLLLEWELVESDEQRLQIGSTLQSTPSGRANYVALIGRQLHLKELQQKGGPRKLTLPNRSTDADLAKLLRSGSLGNLECLSLAFTQVTSACAEELIKLPSLRYLNLWSTQFGDSGLQLISEHLVNLEVLNLCETPVSDKGLLSLTCLQSLKKLNLNSTSLSAGTYRRIVREIPGLKEVDIRYTDAW